MGEMGRGADQVTAAGPDPIFSDTIRAAPGDAELMVTSAMGLVKARETAVRVRGGIRAEAERVLTELADAERVLERRMVVREERAETPAAPASPGFMS
jgi:hypothetical protein